MVILGLTGSIGMGKSVCAAIYRRFGAPVHDADAAVHALMRPGGASFAAVAEAFPAAVCGGAVDRGRLGEIVFRDTNARRRLEAVLHPAVRGAETAFLRLHARRRTPVVVLDIPLLFETGGEDRCDIIAVVSAPEQLQRRRVMRRPGMTKEKLDAVMAAQLADHEKRALADIIIHSGRGKALTARAVRASLHMAGTVKNGVWPRRYMRAAGGLQDT